MKKAKVEFCKRNLKECGLASNPKFGAFTDAVLKCFVKLVVIYEVPDRTLRGWLRKKDWERLKGMEKTMNKYGENVFNEFKKMWDLHHEFQKHQEGKLDDSQIKTL
eukprot:UN01362